MERATPPPGRPVALSIAGFDPSSGAGVTADIKTFEQQRVYGVGVCSALTYQSDTHFEGLKWMSSEEIERQLTPLLERFDIKAVKIGLIESVDALSRVLDLLENDAPDAPIVWDPILSASAGFIFHSDAAAQELRSVLAWIDLVTPNAPEALKLAGVENGTSPEQAAEILSTETDVLLKGGHLNGANATDILFSGGTRTKITAPRLEGNGKHGSGCVLSAAIAAGLAHGMSLVDSISQGCAYVRRFIGSSEGLLGYHAA